MAVNALLEGRVVVLCDNSPIAIILPTTMNNFLKTADDYYNRTIAASFARLIRYVAAFMSFTLPGLLSGGHKFSYTDTADTTHTGVL